MEVNFNTLVITIIIFFILFSSPGGDGISSQYEFNQLQLCKEQYKNEYESFKNTTITSNFRNITGLKLSYEDSLNDPDLNATYPIEGKDYDNWLHNQNYMLLPNEVISNIKHNIWNDSTYKEKDILFPKNITSLLKGETLVIGNEYTPIKMPIPLFYRSAIDFVDNKPPDGEMYFKNPSAITNMTYDSGKMSISVSHLDLVSDSINGPDNRLFNSNPNWKMLAANIEFHDYDEHEKVSFSSLGLYHVETGRVLFMSSSAKFHPLFAFPHYMEYMEDNLDKNSEIFSDVKNLISEYWETKKVVDTLTMHSLNTFYENSMNRCEYMIFLQLEPWEGYTEDQLQMIEDELTWPMGRPANLSSMPPISIKSGQVYSPDCGYTFSLEKVHGIRYELLVKTIRSHVIFGTFLFICQVFLLIRQMQHTNTPSVINKLSYTSFFMINLMDGSLAMVYFATANSYPELYLPLVSSAFVSYILSTIFEMRYIISIFASQVNEVGISIMTLLRGSHQSDEEQQNTRNVVIPDEAAIANEHYGKFFTAMLILLFLIILSTSWPRPLRLISEYIAIFVFNSYWVPQIVRNCIKGLPSRKERRRSITLMNRRMHKWPLLWQFILGTTTIRCIPIIYIFSYPSNVFRHHKDSKVVILLILWLLFQISVLYSQDILGSRWFLPKHSIPEEYSYHRVVSLQHLMEHGGSENHTVDCAICMAEFPVYVEELPETHQVDKDSYMITPCDHMFHTSCLESWMSYKLQCPVCRSPLPPL